MKMEVFNKLKSAVSNVLPGNPLSRDYDLIGQVASCGPGLLWKIYAAVKRSTKEVGVNCFFVGLQAFFWSASYLKKILSNVKLHFLMRKKSYVICCQNCTY